MLATWPLAPNAADHVFGQGTPPLNVWAMAWVLHQLPLDPTHLFDANAFYPYADTLAFSEHMFVPALLGSPVALATGNHVLAHNVVALLTFALAGLGAYLLTRELLGQGGIGAFTAGLFYAFHTWNQNELIRLQVLSCQWFPFLLLAALRYFARPGWQRAAALAVAFVLQCLSCMYWALYAPLLLAAVLPVLQWRNRLSLRQLVPLGATLALAGLLVAPFLAPYLRTSRSMGLARELPEPLDLGRYFDVRAGSVYEGWLGLAGLNQNAAHFQGFVPLALLVLVAVGGAPRFRHLSRGFLWALAAVAFALSLGPELRLGARTLATGPYLFLYEYAPGFRNVRYPERFAVFLALALAPLVGLGVQMLRGRMGRAVAVLAAVLVYAEHLALPTKLAELPGPAGIPSAYHWLAQQPDVRVVGELPVSRYWMERLDALPMYYSTAHWKHTLQGFTGYFPPGYSFMKWRLLHFPEATTLRFLDRLGVDTLVLTPEWPGGVPAGLPYEQVGPFAEGHVVLRARRPVAMTVAPPDDDLAGLEELPRAGWRVQGSEPDAELAIDGNWSTAWKTPSSQSKGDFFKVTFAQPVELARLTLSVRAPYEFPMAFKLVGQRGEGAEEIPLDIEAAHLRLFAYLIHAPTRARLDLDIVPPRVVESVRVRITDSDDYLLPWTLHEVQAYRPRAAR